MAISKKILLIFALLGILCITDGCSKFQQSKRQETQRRKQFEKEKTRRNQEAQSAYNGALKRHYGMQTQNTRKMMKSTAKRSQQFKEHKKPCFLKRWFTPRQKKGNNSGNLK